MARDARRHTVARLAACRSDVGRIPRPSAGSPPDSRAPPAPETSSPHGLRSGPRVLAAGWLLVVVPPVPAAATPNWCCGRSGAPTHPAHSRSAAPSPAAASLAPVRSRVRRNAASDPAAKPRPPPSARPPLPPCPGPVARAPRGACSRRSPGTGWADQRWPPPRWASAAPRQPARPAGVAGERGGAPEDAPSAGPVGETPVAWSASASD